MMIAITCSSHAIQSNANKLSIKLLQPVNMISWNIIYYKFLSMKEGMTYCPQ